MTLEIPEKLLTYFHETNFVTRIELSVDGMGETLFDLLAIIRYGPDGMPEERDAAALSAFLHTWISSKEQIDATVNGIPWRLSAPLRRSEARERFATYFTLTGTATRGSTYVSDKVRARLDSMKPPKLIEPSVPRSIVSLKRRNLVL